MNYIKMSENESVKFLAYRKIVYDIHVQTDVAIGVAEHQRTCVCMCVSVYISVWSLCIHSERKTRICSDCVPRNEKLYVVGT